MSNAKPVQRILSQGGNDLQPILDRARYLNNLTDGLRSQLDSVLAAHINLANIREHTAVISADSAAWLARIRYLAPQILQYLQSQPGLETLHKIQFKIQPLEVLAQNTPTRAASLSPSSAEILHSAAHGIAHKDLSAALERLSRRADFSKKPYQK